MRIFPRGLPAFGAFAPVAWCVSHGLTTLIAGSGTGRLNSTAAIGPFLLFVAALPLSLFGAALGRLAERAAGPAIRARMARHLKWFGPLMLVAIVVAASLEVAIPLYAGVG